MKQLLHQVFSMFMAVLVLASTISWKVEKHYCMGRLMNFSLFVDVDDCGMDMAFMDATLNDGKEKTSCCNDEVFVVDGQDDLKLSFNDLELEQQSFIFVYAHSYVSLFKIQKEQPVPNENYPPPLLVKDLQLLDEVYLI